MASRSTSNVLLASLICLQIVPYGQPSDQCNDVECIFVPTECQLSNDCQITLCYKRLKDSVRFDVSYRFDAVDEKANKYVAVGVSKTPNMDDTFLVYCRFPFEEAPAVGLAYTVHYRLHQLNDPDVVKRNVQLVEASSSNDTKLCKFDQRIIPLDASNKVKSLDDSYHLIVTVGDLDSSGRILLLHNTDTTSKHYPFISADLVNPSTAVCPSAHSVGQTINDSPPRLTKKLLKRMHGALMIVCWCFFGATAVLSARHLKHYKPEKEFCGVKFWFLVHRTFNAVAWMLCLLAFALVFVAASGKWTGTEFPVGTHAILGMTTSVGMFLQPLLAYFRPSLQDSRRPVFNYMHGTIGYGILSCSFATIYMVTLPPFKYNLTSDEEYGVAPQVLIILVIVCFFAIAICLELSRIYRHAMVRKKATVSTRHVLKLEKFPLTLIVVYMAISTVICTALVTFVFL